MLKELLEVERAVRAVLSETVFAEAHCGAEFEGVGKCRARQTKATECPKCGDTVSIDFDCDAEVACDAHCDTDVEVAVDLSDEFRDLRLALVQLDLARERAKETAQHQEVAS